LVGYTRSGDARVDWHPQSLIRIGLLFTFTAGGTMEPSPQNPIKVRLFAGDGTTPLGEADWIGFADVWAAKMPDGSLSSSNDPEVEPPDYTLPPGGVKVFIKHDPKFLMPDGTFKYGCQVWWEKIQTGQTGLMPVSYKPANGEDLDKQHPSFPYNQIADAISTLLSNLAPVEAGDSDDEASEKLSLSVSASIFTATNLMVNAITQVEPTEEQIQKLNPQVNIISNSVYNLCRDLVALALDGVDMSDLNIVVANRDAKAKKPAIKTGKYENYPPAWKRKDESVEELFARMESVPPTFYQTPEMFEDLKVAGQRVADMPAAEQQAFQTRLHKLRKAVMSAAKQ